MFHRRDIIIHQQSQSPVFLYLDKRSLTLNHMLSGKVTNKQPQTTAPYRQWQLDRSSTGQNLDNLRGPLLLNSVAVNPCQHQPAAPHFQKAFQQIYQYPTSQGDDPRETKTFHPPPIFCISPFLSFFKTTLQSAVHHLPVSGLCPSVWGDQAPSSVLSEKPS